MNTSLHYSPPSHNHVLHHGPPPLPAAFVTVQQGCGGWPSWVYPAMDAREAVNQVEAVFSDEVVVGIGECLQTLPLHLGIEVDARMKVGVYCFVLSVIELKHHYSSRKKTAAVNEPCSIDCFIN